MGAILSRLAGSRVGSSTFYEQYERNFERLKAYTIKLKVRRSQWHAGMPHCGAWLVTEQLAGCFNMQARSMTHQLGLFTSFSSEYCRRSSWRASGVARG